jgi:hypothetical protein
MTEAPKCADCRHHNAARHSIDGDLDKCTNPKAVVRYCAIHRQQTVKGVIAWLMNRDRALCGIEGVWFEPKEAQS